MLSWPHPRGHAVQTLTVHEGVSGEFHEAAAAAADVAFCKHGGTEERWKLELSFSTCLVWIQSTGGLDAEEHASAHFNLFAKR